MQTLRAQVQRVLEQAVDTVLPQRCVVTGEIVPQQGMVAPHAWAALDFIADPFCERCGFPFEFEVDEGAVCTSCLSDEPPYDMARSVLKYNDSSRDLILGFKHADKLHAVRTFVPWMQRVGAKMLAEADYLMPVPLHRWRLIARRYNQAGLIAEALSQAVGVSCLLDGVVRIRATPSQGYLTAKERYKNVKRAFAVPAQHRGDIQGRSIVLIDDVYTTGATVKECARALLKAGAGRVSVLTLARVVRF